METQGHKRSNAIKADSTMESVSLASFQTKFATDLTMTATMR